MFRIRIERKSTSTNHWFFEADEQMTTASASEIMKASPSKVRMALTDQKNAWHTFGNYRARIICE